MIQIRHATQADLPGLLTIYNDIIVHTTAVYDYEPHTLAMRQNWFDIKQRDGLPVFVAVDDEAVLGFSSLGPFRAWAAYKFSVENSVYVARDHRGKGIGRLLMQPLIDAAIQLKMHTIIAGIDASNDASIRLHQGFGFFEVAHFKEVGFKFDKWLDLTFLQLILPSPQAIPFSSLPV